MTKKKKRDTALVLRYKSTWNMNTHVVLSFKKATNAICFQVYARRVIILLEYI